MNLTKPCIDNTVIHYMRSNQSNKSGIARCDGTFVDDACIRITRFIEMHFACNEILRRYISSGSHKAVDVHRRTSAKEYAVRVDDYDVTISGKFTKNVGRR